MRAIAGHIRQHYLKWLGALLLLAWLICTGIFAAERWLFADSAYTLFRLLNREPLIYDRFANLLQLWPAMLAVKLGMPATLVLYITNFTLPAGYAAAWIWYMRGRPLRALIFPALLWASGPQMFFLGYSEIGMAALFFGIILCAEPPSGWQGGIWMAGWFTLMFLAHPASLILAAPAVMFAGIRLGKNRLILMAGAAALAWCIQWMVSPTANPYDRNLLSQLGSPQVWKSLKQAYSLQYFRQSITGWMWPSWVALLFTSWTLRSGAYPRRYWFISGYAAISLLVILVVYAAGDAPVMMEKYFYPWVIICVGSALYFLRLPVVAALFSLAVAISGFLMLNRVAGFYAGRLKELQVKTSQYRELNQTLILSNNRQVEQLGSVWALPYETMCLSALEERPTVTVRISDNGQLKSDAAAAADSLFLGAPFMPPWPKRLLHQRYFNLKQEPYFIDSVAAH